jgi:hypothetical protein
MNKFKKHEEDLVKQVKHSFEKLNLMYKCDGSGIANWCDDWTCFPNNKRTLLRFSKWVSTPEEKAFDIARAFAIEMCNRNLSHEGIVISVQFAFRVCDLLNKRVYNIEQEDFSIITASLTELNYSTKNANHFWSWCKKNQLIPEYLVLPTLKDKRNRSPEEEDIRHSKMLISDEQVAAVGVAYHELYSEDGLKKYGFKAYPQEYLAIAFCTLGMATPSRLDAEIWGLPTQQIQTHDDTGYTDKENDENVKKSYSLFWKGSKNYPDNRTMLLSVLKDNVEKTFEVIEKESLPAKILSLFMTSPTLSLNQVMEEYPDYEYKIASYPSLDFQSKTNIFHLGLILGLYDEEPRLPVHGLHDESIKVHGKKSWQRFNYLGNIENDTLIANHHSIISLYRKSMSKFKQPSQFQHQAFKNVKEYLFKKQDSTTLTQLSDLITEANKFLNGSVDTITRGKNIKTKVSEAMFVFTSSTLNNRKIEQRDDTFATELIPVPTMYNLHISTKRPHFNKKWIASALALVGLESMAFGPHQLRHWVNHHAKESGIPISVVNLWSGRKDADQAYEYIHTIDEDNAKQINSILVNKSEMEPSSEIKLMSIKKIKDMSKLPATIMSEGVCIQDLVTMPCRFLNDFMTSCFGCQEMCYIKGDVQALSNLKFDLEVQTARLSKVKLHPGFAVNTASQKWFKTHFNKTSVLTSLIDVLEDDVIPEGSSVRMSGDLSSLEFRVQNLDTAQIAVKQFVLEGSSKALNKLLENTKSNKKTSNLRLAGLLSSYGVKNDEK